MRRTARCVLIIPIAGWALCLAAPALAKDPLLAGGGGGGVCYEQPPALDFGWVAAGDNCFAPRVTEVATGDAVRWSLEGQASHTVTFDGGPDAGILTGDGFAITFNAPGNYEYFCSFHPGMAGSIRAVGDSLSGPALEVLGMPTAVASSGRDAAVLRDSVPMRVEFSPLTAAVVLAVGLPLSLGLATRLVGFAWTAPGSRRRVGSMPSRAQRPPARR